MYCPLTDEDHLIYRARMSVATQARLHKADRADAVLMELRTRLRAALVEIRERQYTALADHLANESSHPAHARTFARFLGDPTCAQ